MKKTVLLCVMFGWLCTAKLLWRQTMSLTILMSTLFLACGTAEKEDTADTAVAEATSEPTSEPASSPTVEEEETGCADLPTAQECFECFANENMTGYTAYANALISNCYCSTECGETCTDFCLVVTGVTPFPRWTCVQTVGNDRNRSVAFSAAWSRSWVLELQTKPAFANSHPKHLTKTA